jgi:rubrerythrin
VSDGFGEAYLVWQCLDCGTIGSLDALPTRCVCGARREDLVYVVED